MIYNNNSKGGKPGGSSAGAELDLNKKRLAEEAKRIKDSREAAQRQQEKSRLQLQIENRKRELIKIEQDLQARELRLAQQKRELDEAKRKSFALTNQIKVKAGGLDYLKTAVETHDSLLSTREAELAQIKTKQDRVLADIARLKKEIAELQTELNSKNLESEKLIQDHKSLELNSKQVDSTKERTVKETQLKKKEIDKHTDELFLRDRRTEELARGTILVQQEIEKLKREKTDKEREIKDLEIKRDQIGLV